MFHWLIPIVAVFVGVLIMSVPAIPNLKLT